jgi:hypothetical protein
MQRFYSSGEVFIERRFTAALLLWLKLFQIFLGLDLLADDIKTV